jgi:hypothetical protein
MNLHEIIERIIDSGLYRIIILFLLIFLIRIFFKKKVKIQTDVDNLVKLAEDLQCSEYMIFHDAAKKWSFSENKVEEDFKRYLLYGELPRYVKEYVEEHIKG